MNGCTSTSAPFTVTVNALPTISGPSSVCVGSTIQLTGSGVGTWTSTDPGFATVDNTGKVTGISQGVAQIKYTNSNGCTQSVMILVSGLPAVNILPNGPLAICQGSSINLNANTEPGLTYSWTPGGSTGSSINVNQAGTYTLTGTKPGTGCSNSASVTVTVNPAPPTPTISGANTMCSNSAITLTSSAATGNMWSTGANTQSITVFSAGSFTVTTTDANNCSATSAPFNVTVNQRPNTAPVSGGGSYCQGGSGVTVSLGSSQVGFTYSLILNGNSNLATLPGTGSALTFTNVTTAGSYTIFGSSPVYGCTTPMNGSVNVSINPAPTVYNVSSSGNICANGPGYSINLSGSDPANVRYEVYLAGNPTGITMMGNGSSISFSGMMVSGVFTIWATNTVTNCKIQMNGSTTVNLVPTPTISGVTGALTVCSGLSTTLTASSAAISPVFSWYNVPTGGSPISGSATLNTGSLTATTTFYVQVSSQGCTSARSGFPVTVNPIPATINYSTIDNCNGSVTITANNLAGGNSILWSTGATINPITVAAAGTYSATQKNSFGCSSLSAPINVTIKVPPTVFNVTGGGSYCTNDFSNVSVNLSGSDLGAMYQLRRNGSMVSSVPGTGSPISFMNVMFGSGTYDILAFRNGCPKPMSGSVQITANTPPLVAPITGPNSVCLGGTIQLSDITPGGTWHTNNPVLLAVNSTGLVTGLAVGTDTIGYKVTDANGCANGVPYIVTVTPTPVVTVAADGPTALCPGGTVALAITSGATDGVWSSSDLSVASVDASGNVFAAGSGTATITYTVLNASGCSGIATVQITVFTAPAAPVITVTDNCDYTFNFSTPVIAGISYSWSYIGNDYYSEQVTSTAASFNGANPGSGTAVYLTVTDANDCSAQANEFLNGYINPVAPLDSVAPICVGNSGSILVRAPYTPGAIWSSSDNSVISVTPFPFFPLPLATLTANGPGNAVITYTVTTASGCVYSTSVTVNVPAIPDATITADGPTRFCEGGSVTLTSSSASGNLWSTGETTQSIFVTTPGDYTVTVTDNGCSATSVLTKVLVDPLPGIPSLAVDGPTQVCPGSTVTLYTNALGYTYQWYKDGISVGPSDASSYTATVSGVYSVVITNENGCSFSSATINVTIEDITAPVINCAPLTIQLGANGVYQLDLNNLLTGGNQQPPVDPKILAMIAVLNQQIAVLQASVHDYNVQLAALSSPGDDVEMQQLTIAIKKANEQIAYLTQQIKDLQAQTKPKEQTKDKGKDPKPTGGLLGTVFDDCGIASITISQSSFDCSNIGLPVTVTITVTDVNNNVSTCLTTITVEDATPPVAPVLPDIIEECSATVTAPVAMDACAGPIVGIPSGPVSFTDQGDYVITWTFDDGHNNQTVVTQNVFVHDVTKPTIVCPETIIVSANAQSLGIDGSFVTYAAATATDNCGNASLTYSVESGSFFAIGTHTVTVTAADGHGNTSSCTFEVIVNCIKPTIVCAETQTKNTDPGKCGAVVYYNSTITLGTPAGVGTYSFTGATTGAGAFDGSGSFFNTGITFVTVTMTNSCGTASCTFQVVVEDHEPPTIIAPNMVVVDADANCSATGVNLGHAITGDNCAVLSVTNDAPATFPLGNTTVTWTVTDVNHNTNTATQVVTVIDHTDPVIVCPDDIILTANTVFHGVAGSEASYEATATDNCGTVSLSYSIPSGNFFAIGSTPVTVTATDVQGNSVSCTFNVIVKCVLPTITCPSDKLVNTDAGRCYANVSYSPTITLGLPAATVSYAFTGATTGSGSGDGSGSNFNTGTTEVTITVTNICGTVSCKFIVTVRDAERPTITAPVNVTVSADAHCQATHVDLGTPATGDNCAVDKVTNDATGIFPLGTTTVKWIVYDVNGNSNTATQTVTVVDDTKPSLTCPTDIVVDADVVEGGVSGAHVTYRAATTDNCNIPAITYSSMPGSFFTIGTHTVTVTATDASGNTSTCDFTVTVNCVKPTIVDCPTDIGVFTDAGTCGAVVTYNSSFNLGLPAATVSYSFSRATAGSGAGTGSGSVFRTGTTLVTVTATNMCGSVSCSFNVTVKDAERPMITAPANVTVSANANCTATGVDLGSPVTGDNCGTRPATNDAPAIFPIGTTTVTWTVFDVNGNSNTATQTVTVVDDTKPNLTCPTDIVVDADVVEGGVSGAHVTYTATATDNCNVPVITYSSMPGSFFTIGTHTVTVTATDAGGNTSTCDFTVTVKCVQPVITECPGNQTVSTDAGRCSALVNYNSSFNLGLPEAGVSYVFSGATTGSGEGTGSGLEFNTGTTTVTITATNDCGTAVCTFTVTVNDTELPQVNCKAHFIVSLDANGVGVIDASAVSTGKKGLKNPLATASDNCGIAEITIFPNQFDCTNLGENTVTVTVRDINGNISSCTTTVLVVDNHAPLVTVPNDVVVNNTPGKCGADLVLGTPTVSDNCSFTVTSDAPATFPVGTTDVTWTVTDAGGNVVTVVQHVTVNDTEAPVVTLLPVITGECDATVPQAFAMDNCNGLITGTTSDPLTYSGEGTYFVNWTFTDAAGNISTAVQKVVIDDVTPPSLTCPRNIVVTANTTEHGIAGAYVAFAANATDNCGTPTLTYSLPSGNFFPVGTYTITVMADDGNGNTSQCRFDITVECVKPTIVDCPGDIGVLTDAGTCGAVVTYNSSFNLGLPAAGVSYSFSGATSGSGAGTGSGSTFNTGTTAVTVTATNMCGSVSCSFNVTVKDAERPTITAPANVTVSADANCTGYRC
jgi:hypothetical protein